MAWQGKTLGEICAQIKDPKRNGGKSLEELVDHMAEDSPRWMGVEILVLVESLRQAHQKEFGALAKAWVESGAACPSP